MNTPIATLAELRKQPHWSYSSLHSLLQVCGLQWAFGHVYEQEPAFTPVSLALGKAFHRACAQLTLLRRDGPGLPLKEAQELFAAAWKLECAIAEPPIRYEEDEAADLVLATGMRVLSAWHAAQQPEERVLTVSQPFAVPLVDSAGSTLPKVLVGEFDAVIVSRGLRTVVDWKTSASRWPADKPQRDLQATAYLYAQRRQPGGDRAVFRYDVVTKAKTPSYERLWTTREPEDDRRFVELVKRADALVEHELFIPNESSFACKGCQFTGACQRWHRTHARTVVPLAQAA